MSHMAEPDEHPPHQSTAQRMLSRWATLGTALIAVVALGVAVWALLRPPSDTPPPSPTSEQVAEAKGSACAAYNTVRAAVALQTRADVGTDPVAAQAVAANARLAMAVGSQHLLDNLSPEVPPELAGLLRSVAMDLQSLTINALTGAADNEASQLARLQALEANSVKIVELCK